MNMKKFTAFTGATFIVALVTVISVPASSFAANYAYVDKMNEVKMFVADNATAALRYAPNMHVNSGVMLLDSTEDSALFGTSL
jgi:hypothetical protein